MYFYCLKLGPLLWDHLGPWDIALNEFGRRPLEMLHTKFQTSEHSGSKEEDIGNFIMYFYGLNLGPPGAGPASTQGLSFEQNW